MTGFEIAGIVGLGAVAIATVEPSTPLEAFAEVWTATPWRWTSWACMGAATWLAVWALLARRRGSLAVPSPAPAGAGEGRCVATFGAFLALSAAAVFVLAFVSPLGALADGVAFSAHMAQHLLLLLVVPLLAVMALPQHVIESMAACAPWKQVAAVLAIAPLGWLLGLGAMWAWHEPSACSAAATRPALGMVRDASFVLAGVAFWWPIAGPIARARLAPPMAMAYLISACLACTMLGILITFTPVAMCPLFAAPAESAARTALRARGFSAAVDQQLGGLLMWVPPCLLYAIMSLRAVAQWQRGHVGGEAGGVPTPATGRSPDSVLELNR